MKLIVSAQAEAELEAIGDFVAANNPTRAISFVHELRAAAKAIADMPRAYPLIPRYEALGIRRKPYRDYLILYRVEGDRLIILHIVHGSRDLERLIFPD
jgi:toxin ParE1/3/4